MPPKFGAGQAIRARRNVLREHLPERPQHVGLRAEQVLVQVEGARLAASQRELPAKQRGLGNARCKCCAIHGS
jgi:hypothetical protein